MKRRHSVRCRLLALSLLLSIPSGDLLAFRLDPDNIRVIASPANPVKTVFDSYVPESFLLEFNPQFYNTVRRFEDTALVVPKHREDKDVGNYLYLMLENGRKASEIAKVTVEEFSVGDDPVLRQTGEIRAWDASGGSIPLLPTTSVFLCSVDESTDSRILEFKCVDVRFEGDRVLNRLLLIRFTKFGFPSLGICDGGNPRNLVKKIEVPGKTLVCGYVFREGVVANSESSAGEDTAGQGPAGLPSLPQSVPTIR